jgi:F420-dependent oxidoreductase-like protein
MATKLGVKTGQGGYSYEELRKVWTAADELGYDSAWLYDHFFALEDKQAPCLEAWTTLAALAAATKRLKLGTMVTSVSYRHPSLLAKMATTTDVISNGRLIVGMGAGWYEEEYVAYGYDFPDQRTRVRQLKEALIILRKLWTEEHTTFDGKFYSLHDAVSSPKPRQKGGPPIIVGIMKGKRTLPLFAVKYADGFNTPGSFEECKATLASVRENCERYGRKMDDLIASWQGFILIGKSQSKIQGMIERSAKRRGQSPSVFRKMAAERGWVIGEPDQCVQKLRKVKDLGINHIILSFSNDTEITPLELFMDQVAPQLR